jgi:hypothetical protein
MRRLGAARKGKFRKDNSFYEHKAVLIDLHYKRIKNRLVTIATMLSFDCYKMAGNAESMSAEKEMSMFRPARGL